VVLAVLLVPLVYGVGFSLFRKTIMMLRPEFVGLANYVELIVHERFFLNSIKNSLIWSVMVVSVTTLISFTSAMLLNQRLRFRRLIRTAILLPWITAW
jgi:multiple sugar transport system permease protein